MSTFILDAILFLTIGFNLWGIFEGRKIRNRMVSLSELYIADIKKFQEVRVRQNKAFIDYAEHLLTPYPNSADESELKQLIELCSETIATIEISEMTCPTASKKEGK